MFGKNKNNQSNIEEENVDESVVLETDEDGEYFDEDNLFAKHSYVIKKEKVIPENQLTQEEDLKIKEIVDHLQNEFTSVRQNALLAVRKKQSTIEQFQYEVYKYLKRYYPDENKYYNTIMENLRSYIFGYYKLDVLINDPNISDIGCLAYNNIRVKIKGKNQQAFVTDAEGNKNPLTFSDENSYNSFVNYVASKNNVNTTNINAIQIFTDRTSSEYYVLRFVIVMPILTSSNAPYLCIRKIRKDFPEMDELVEEKMFTNEMKEYFVERFKQGSFLVSGPSASGKTTFLNALKETIPHDKSVLICQETEEMSAKNHPYMMLEHPMTTRGEGKVNYSLYDIVAAGLLMNVNYFLIGEIKGKEASYLLNAAYTGHICATTIHSQSAMEALDKLTDYAKYNSDYKKEELMKMLCTFKTLVYIQDYKVMEIYEVEGWDENKKQPICTKKVFDTASMFS